MLAAPALPGGTFLMQRGGSMRRSLAKALALLACLPAAARAQDAALAKVQDGANALQHGNAGQAVAAYTEALNAQSIANDRRASILNDRAVAYIRLGQTRAAFEDFNRAVQLFPEYAATYNNRGNLLLALGLPKEAVKDFDRAIVLAPGYAAAYNNRAGALMRLGQTDDAVRDYSKAIALLPSNPAPLAGRGRALMTQGRPHAAIRDFSRAVSADARFAAAYRARAEAKTVVGRLEEAIEDLSRAIAFDPNNGEIYMLRGHAYLASSNAASAIKDFARVVDIDPQGVAGYQARGLANGVAEAFDDAFADLNRAIELDPRSPLSFAYRAVVYRMSGQPDIAQKDVATALKLDANLAEALWAEGELAEAAGNKDAAIASLRKALAAKPSLKQASAALERLGAGLGEGEDVVVAGAGIDKWRVVTRKGGFYAVNEEYPRLRVPLEMGGGEAQPKLLEWEAKKPPFKGIGVLRFSGGKQQAKSGAIEVEMAAIVDLVDSSVIAIETHRIGDKVASWTWDEGKVVVASADGVTDEFQLRNSSKPREQAPVAERKREEWAQQSADRRNDRPRKPKTIFDLLFGN